MWMFASHAANQVIRLGANVVLTYLLYPAAFTIMALVNGVLAGLEMLSDVGLGPSIVQHKRGDEPRFLNTAFTLQIIRGLVLGVICILIAGPAAAAYATRDELARELPRLLPIAAATVVISGFASPRVHTAARHLALGRLTLLELTSRCVGIAVMITWALIDRDVIALVMGSIAAALARVTLSHWWLPGTKSRLAWDPEAVSAILRFGGWIFLSTVLAFLAMQLDKFMFASTFPEAEVGVYQQATQLAMMMPMVMGTLQTSVAFPLYSRIIGRGGDLRAAVETVKAPLMAITGLMMTGAVACGPTFVATVYDSRWHEAGWMVALLAVGAWFAVLDGIYGAALLAKGKARWVALSNLVKVTAFVLLYMVGAEWYGMVGAVAACALSDMAKIGAGWWGAGQIGVRMIASDLYALLRTVLLTLPAWLVAYLLPPEDGYTGPGWLALLAAIAIIPSGPLIVKQAQQLLALRRPQ